MFITKSVRTKVKKPTITVNQITESMGLNHFSESNTQLTKKFLHFVKPKVIYCTYEKLWAG